MNQIIQKRSSLVILFICISGISALIYQITWIREFKLVFGVHVFSTSAVLSSFMAGLALGSYFFGKLIDKNKKPLLILLFIEAGILVFALTFPLFFNGVIEIYSFLNNAFELSIGTLQLIRFMLAFLLLIIPTSLMGGTIPVISKYFVLSLQELGYKISKLYSANNIGAVIGCLIAGFLLIRSVGLRNTTFIAAFLNLLNAGLIYFLYKREKNNPQFLPGKSLAKSEPANTIIRKDQKPLDTLLIKISLWVFALEGFTTLAYEVIWTRVLLEFSFDKTVYFYTIVIVSFLFGLSFGAFLIRKRVDRIRNYIVYLAVVEGLIGISSFLLFLLFSGFSPYLINHRVMYENFFLLMLNEYLLIFILLSIPTTLMGMTFPLVGKIYTHHIRNIGKKIGILGFLDTIGSIFGSFAAGFLLIPLLGIYYSMLFVVVLNIISAIILIYYETSLSVHKRFIYIAIPVILIIAGIIMFPSEAYYQHRIGYYPDEKILSYDEGVAATVTVHKTRDGYKSLAINGAKTAFANTEDIRVHRMLGSQKPFTLNYTRIKNKFLDNSLRMKLYDVDLENPEVFLSKLLMDSQQIQRYISGSDSNTDNFPRVEFSTEMDLKPNIHVLSSLIDKNTDYQNIITGVDSSQATSVFDKINIYKNRDKSQIEQFIHAYRK